jgi:2-polyprenyl-3-methyl-5-hydroxy-6-metoxy-1,4-benzoquinol methylase
MKVFSPFNLKKEAVVLSKVETKEIINGYLKVYNVDVSEYFKTLEEIYICECLDTKLKFYYPFNLDGDSLFYEQLSLNDWYYSNTRWEHKEAIALIKEHSSVLEIGPGDGFFLQELNAEKKVNYVGLELNSKAIEKARLRNIILTGETLHQHVLNPLHQKHYDVVCSFQVLEHISNIDSIISDSVQLLKKGGLLIIAVPNNDASFLKRNYHPSRFLNMPPHHVNLFTEESLLAIAKHFNLKVKSIIKEPLQKEHEDVFVYNLLSKMVFNVLIIVKVLWRLRIHKIIKPFLGLLKKKELGHTIIVVLEK